MNKFDQRIDTYIGLSADFARPILLHLRRLIHKAVPQIGEKIKWGKPYFSCEGPICFMSSDGDYCTFGFSQSDRMPDPHQLFEKHDKHIKGQFGKLTSVDDLPPDEIMIEYIRHACSLNEKDARLPIIKMLF